MREFSSILRNTVWNLGGWGLPVLIAIISIPLLLRELGDTRFGILAIVWAILAYFVLSDFGIGRATVKLLAPFNFSNGADWGEAHTLIWTSLIAHAVIGLAMGSLLLFSLPLVIGNLFSIPLNLIQETEDAFFWLAASIPILLITSCLRNVLEARCRFDLVNILRAPASSINYLIPVLTLMMSNSLAHILASMFVFRLFTLAGHWYCATLVFPQLRDGFRFSRIWLKKMFGFGFWIIVSSLINPVYLIADRLIIASIFSMAAVSYYVAPYEIVTRLWILSASLLAAMFPVLGAANPHSTETRNLVDSACRLLVVAALPLVVLIIVFGRDGLSLWLSPDFAEQSGTVIKWLALGVFFNILAQVPLTFLQATGRPDKVAYLQLALLPLFVAASFLLSRHYGTVGVAMAWAARSIVEAGILQIITFSATNLYNRVSTFLFQLCLPSGIFLISSWLIERGLRELPWWRTLVFIPLFCVLVIWLWRQFISEENKAAVIGVLKRTARLAP